MQRHFTGINRRTWLAVLFMLTVIVPAQGSAQKADDGLAARIQRIEDVEAIKRVLLTYGRALDALDLDTYASLFAANGEWSGGLGTAIGGPAGVLAFMKKNLGGGGPRPEGAPRSYHLMSNFVIDVDGDRATSWSRWSFVRPGTENNPAISIYGIYEDTLIRENGTWKFLRRKASNGV
jgi:hypothetical protein